MKFNKVLLTGLISLSAFSIAAAYADPYDQSVYFGGQAGYARANFGDLDSDIKNLVQSDPFGGSSRQGGFAGRLYAGFNFNQFFAVEGGYSFLPNNKYTFNGLGDVRLTTNAWDVVGKASLPLAVLTPALDGFSVYVKGGAAYVTSKFDIDDSVQTFTSAKAHGWAPTYGAGVAYNFNRNLAMDVSWTQIYGHGSDSTTFRTPTTNAAMVGLTVSLP